MKEREEREKGVGESVGRHFKYWQPSVQMQSPSVKGRAPPGKDKFAQALMMQMWFKVSI